ncbi:cytosine permease [Pilimelia terevasa]|uniref:Cytosine permease n=1 Tax=Pilimelia terevasa TaxID=53372 RepID=A0A8J3BGU4_9ACTN|nr:cytosine permease [Pilimelia terevasa]GGK20272.1 cytosine permease [Pilimelia terevasa]
MNTQTDSRALTVGHDDYSLVRVPESERRSWISVAVQRFGQVSSFQQFMVGAILGYGMTFWNAVIAITIGSALLEVITILLGIAGVREGLSTSVLSRWAGFGKRGSALVGMLVAVSLAGWFGVQNGVFAQGMHDLTGWSSEWVWALLGGAAITAVTTYGFRTMAWVGYLAVPAFLVLALISIADALRSHSIGDLIASPPPGPTLSLGAGITLVSGAFILGAIMTPDMTRFNRRPSDVVKQTLTSVTLGQYGIGLIGVLLAHAARTDDVVGIVVSSSGVLGTLVLATSILKINDWNLYSSSLGLVNSVHVLTGRRVSRVPVTIALGVLGTLLSAVGIVHSFAGFLTAIGMLAPPVAGIIIAEYYLVRTYRTALEDARLAGTLPADPPDWAPRALISWVAGTAAAVAGLGSAAITSIVVAFVVHTVLGRMSAARGGRAAKPTTPIPATGTKGP